MASYFGGLAPGMIAYFNALDARGGINGRKLVLTNNLDDGGSPTEFEQDAHNLIEQDHVFAVAVASAWFAPTLFVQTKSPTYGYNVTDNWQDAPNLFAVSGSTQIYSATVPVLSWFAKQLKLKSVAFVSYNSATPGSYAACHALSNGMSDLGYRVDANDDAQIGGSYTSVVQNIQRADSQLVVSCMQSSDDISLGRTIQQYGLKIHQLWLNGYDQALLKQYQSIMQGVYIDNVGNVPFEAGNMSKYGNLYPGMLQYLAAMKKYEPSFAMNSVSFDGWWSAALIAAGIRAAGSNPTQAKVIAATNAITDFTGDGISAPVDWKVSHTSFTTPQCTSWLQVKGNQYVPALSKGKQVFVCLSQSAKNPTVVKAPAGTPGA